MKPEFEIGQRYKDLIEDDSFEVKAVNNKSKEVSILYDNGTHGYVANSDGTIDWDFCDLDDIELINHS